MTSLCLKSILFVLSAFLLADRAEALQIQSIEFSGLDELQILNVRSELSLAESQLEAETSISENRLDYLTLFWIF